MIDRLLKYAQIERIYFVDEIKPSTNPSHFCACELY